MEQTELQEVQARLSQLDSNNRNHMAEIQALRTREIELLKQVKLEQDIQQEQETREQEKAATIDGLLQAIRDLAIFEMVADRGEEESIADFDERRKTHDLIWFDFIKEQIQAVHDKYDAVIEQKDEKFRMLTKQGLQVQNQLDEALNRVSDLEQKHDLLMRENQELDEARKMEYESHCKTVESLGEAENEIITLKTKVQELESKLEKAQAKPSEYTAPSQSLQERVKSLAPIKALKDRSPDEILARFNERLQNGGKVELPQLPQKEDTFRLEDPSTLLGHVGIPSPESVQVTAEQFRESSGNMDEPAAGQPYYDGSGIYPGSAGNDEKVSQADFQALKAKVEDMHADLESIKVATGYYNRGV